MTWASEPYSRLYWEIAVRDFADLDVEVHPKGLIYLPHERLRHRLNAAFGAGFYKFVPLGDPKLGENECIWRFRLSFRDGTEAEAFGHATYIKNKPSYSYGDALETCSSDAFARCCKAVGIGLQVWNRDYQIYFMRTYAVEVQSTKTGQSQWRRRDRPPIPYERRSRDQPEPDYVPRETLDQENRKHFDSLAPPKREPLAKPKPQPLSREEATWQPDDDEQLRRLYEMADDVLATEGSGE